MAGTFPPAQTVKDAVAVSGKYSPESIWAFVGHFPDMAGMPVDVGTIFKTMGDIAATLFPKEPDLANLLYGAQVVMNRTAGILDALDTDARRALEDMFAKIQDSPNGHLYNKNR